MKTESQLWKDYTKWVKQYNYDCFHLNEGTCVDWRSCKIERTYEGFMDWKVENEGLLKNKSTY